MQGQGARVVVAGAGATGLTVALALARAGAAVTVRDPAALGDNASGVAAGMLAPAFEAALDPVSAGHFDLLKAARDLWPAMGPPLDRSGAIYAGDRAQEVAARLAAMGAEHRWDGPRLFTPEDWRLEPRPALAALKAQAEREGVRFEACAVTQLDADVLVLATGADGQGLAPELAALTPVKGHILRFEDGPTRGPVVRGEGVYVCPSPAGALVGATMETGVTGREIDAARVQALKAAAAELGLTGPATAQAGVRAATPDGLPLVGWSSRRGVLLAVGARRNGWLLAPLVAAMAAAYLRGQEPGPYAALLDARRFIGGDRP